MDEISNVQGCMIPTHTNKNLALFCIDRKCKQTSRILCQKCLMQKSQFHANCDTYLTFDDIKSNELTLEYSDHSRIFPLFEQAYRPVKEINETIDSLYDGIFTKISHKISELKKETKIKVADRQQKLKKDLEEYLKKQNDLSNLEDLQKEIKKFNENLINSEKLNEILTQKQQQHFTQQEEETYLQKYRDALRKHDIKEIDPNIFKKLEKSLLNSLNCYQLYPNSNTDSENVQEEEQSQKLEDSLFQQQRENPQKDEEIKQLKEELQYFHNLIRQNKPNSKITGSKQSLTLIPGCNGTFRKENNKYIKTSGNGSHLNFMSEPFKRNENVLFKFSLYNYTGNKHVIAGITTMNEIQNERYNLWFNQGNQKCFNSQNNVFRKKFAKKGEKTLPDVCYEGQVFTLEVCVEQNKITLKDQWEDCIMENRNNFKDDQEQDWVIVIGDNGYQNQNFTIELL